jgi:hypothetical protein
VGYTTILKALWTLANLKVPIWICLIAFGLGLYALNRPIPERVETKIEYRTQFAPPVVNRTLPPSRLVNYARYPQDKLRVDTVFVPIEMTSYQLWQPEQVHRRSNSIVVRSFDPSDTMYRDYEFKPLEAKFRGFIEMYGLYPHRIGLDASVYRGRVGLFGRIEQGQDLYYGVGIKYRLY